MTQRPMTEEQAKDLFVRQLKDLGRPGAAPSSQARMAGILAKHEAACRREDSRLEAVRNRAEAARKPIRQSDYPLGGSDRGT